METVLEERFVSPTNVLAFRAILRVIVPKGTEPAFTVLVPVVRKECNTGDPQLDVSNCTLRMSQQLKPVACTADADCAGAGNEMQCQSGLCKLRRRGVIGDATVVPVGGDSGAIPGGVTVLAALLATIRVRKPACRRAVCAVQWCCRMHPIWNQCTL